MIFDDTKNNCIQPIQIAKKYLLHENKPFEKSPKKSIINNLNSILKLKLAEIIFWIELWLDSFANVEHKPFW